VYPAEAELTQDKHHMRKELKTKRVSK